jgi:hypothetical protein
VDSQARDDFPVDLADAGIGALEAANQPQECGLAWAEKGCARRTHGRVVTLGQLVLFSTETGDAWLLDPSDHLAARLARDGDPEPVHIEENDSSFVIAWKGAYHIEGPAFINSDRQTRRVSTILGYPTGLLAPPA